MPNWNTLNPSCKLEKLSSAAVSHCVKGNHFLDRDLYFAREQCVPISRTCSHNYFVKNSVKSTYLVQQNAFSIVFTKYPFLNYYLKSSYFPFIVTVSKM